VGEFLFIYTDIRKQHTEQGYWTAAKTVNAQMISNQMRQVFCEPSTVLNMCARHACVVCKRHKGSFYLGKKKLRVKNYCLLLRLFSLSLFLHLHVIFFH
jgi:hypothetical protein